MPARAAGTPLVFPDLVPDRADRLWLDGSHTAVGPSGEQRLLLRYDGYVHNRGPGSLEIRGSFPAESTGETIMVTNVQRVYRGRPSQAHADFANPGLQLVYVPSLNHQHFHVRGIVSYQLVEAGTGAVTEESAKNRVGFCLIDAESRDADAATQAGYTPAASNDCGYRDPAAAAVTMGLSAGWRDRYWRELQYQWVDVSDVQPGVYQLHPVADPDDVIREEDESNNDAGGSEDVAATIPGYQATPIEARTLGGAPTAIELGATRFSSAIEGAPQPGSVEFRIVRQPQHGHLLVSGEAWASGATAVYIPNTTYKGADSFSYVARDHDHPLFPREPKPAGVKVTVG
ncbi:MAG TPA: lysyl oxidase family protein [Thermoleophilaceae bacterium]|jgi:hypothetical protein